MEVAAGRRIERRRDLASHRRERALPRLDAPDLGEQRPRVRMAGLAEERLRRSALDDAAEVHDDDAVADVPDDAEIVADEQVGERKRALQLDEQVEHLRLDRDVERGDGLVAHEELGLHRARARDARLAYARALVAEKQYDEARAQFRILLGSPETADNGDVIFAVGVLSLQLRDFDEAETQLKRLVQTDHAEANTARAYLGQIGEDRSNVDLSQRYVRVTVDLHAGQDSATILTNDLTYDYVKENAEYST